MRRLWCCLLPSLVLAQDPQRGELYAPRGADADTVAPAMAREFRGVWLATVANIDWPSRPGLPVDSQKQELRALFDVAQRSRLNAIIFQVRPAADALYESRLEPWSYFLTGQMGRPPEPRWDPLAYAIREAHARGMELHAWFNPYRSRHPGDKGSAAATHVSRQHPGWHKRYGSYGWMDPGEPGVRRRTLDVILDVVRRYDVDGVHLDDYFYPYPELNRRRREIPFPDEPSWRRYRTGGGTLSRDDWRRRNVDQLLQELYAAVKREKAWVKVGISPFGIWRPGYPASVSGFDAYQKLYADSRRWLHEGWVDYFTPQLYWRLGAPSQPYADLLQWWLGENRRQRHVWPGNYTSRASDARRTTWAVREIFDQVLETRRLSGTSTGNIHFSMTAFPANSDGFLERLGAGVYAEPALPPPSPWLTATIPSPPTATARVDDTGGVDVTLTPNARTNASPRGSAADARWWVVRARYGDGWRVHIVPADRTVVRLAPDPMGDGPRHVTVSAVDRVGLESSTQIVAR